tara:strand:- start:1296 stop:2036 length:741 start_codon:yes stop_codon:yes gene_type:complete
MALEFKLKTIKDLDDSVKDQYKKVRGGYELDIDGLPEQEPPEVDDNHPFVQGMKNKLDELLREKKEAAKKAKEAETEAEIAKLESAKAGNDTEALDKSWTEKYTTRETELQDEINNMGKAIIRLTSGQTAAQIASEIAVSGSAEVLVPHLEARLKTEIREGVPTTIVLDKSGQPCAMTMSELKTEFQNSEAFAPLIVGTKANGAGRTGGNESGGATSNTVKRSEFNSMSQTQRSNHAKQGGTVIDD